MAESMTTDTKRKSRPMHFDITRVVAFSIVLIGLSEILVSMHFYMPTIINLLLVLCCFCLFIIAWIREKKTPFIVTIPLYLYLVWIGFRSIVGFQYSGHWEYFWNLIKYIPATFLICSIQFLSKKKYFVQIIDLWKKSLVPCLLLIAILCSSLGTFGFFLCIVQIYLIWIKVFNRRTQVIILLLAALCILGSALFGDPVRASIVKYGFALLLGLSCYFRRFITSWMLKTAFVICFIAPVFLFYTAATGGYSIFAAQEEENVDDDKFADTRTTLFVESITSAIDNNYILVGRTPARGYDSAFEQYRNNKPERMAEVSMINIFTWYGIVGVILYTLLFFQVTRYGLFRSNNYYIKILAVYLAFRYTMAWVEDCNRFDSVNISLWVMMSCCYLPSLRKLTNKKFRTAIAFMNF